MRTHLPLTLVLASFCGLVPASVCRTPPGRGTQEAKEEKKTEVLNALTDQERSLNPRDILLAQPDFAADFSFFVNERFGGYGFAEHVVRKGERFREESQFWTFVEEVGKSSVRLYPESKTYDDMIPRKLTGESGSLLYPKAFALEPEATFKALGTVEIQGHRCLKIEVLPKEKDRKNYLYAAMDLGNLIIVNQDFEPRVTMIQKLSHVSLDVPDAMVEIPADFKPVEHVRWTKVESAKVIYNGKPSSDFGVFRAATGEMFIWIRDAFYPWEYLYRPKKGTVEIAFEGLLVNRSGTDIWKTNETEAFSLRNYLIPFNSNSKVTLTKPNTIEFRSESYEQDKAMIEVTW